MTMVILCPLIQADNHQENLVLSEVKKLETDGLVKFITTNEVRYITEYNQVVRPTRPLTSSNALKETSACSFSFSC